MTTFRIRLPLLAAIFASCAAFTLSTFAENEDHLLEYVQRPDETFSFSAERIDQIGSEAEAHLLRLTSQKWRGLEWNHRLVVITPPQIKHPKNALLIVSGGSNEKERPLNPSRVEFDLGTEIAETF
ncbi:MAG TPA: PhoPQ-activated protein PqaA family protein, partial [Opitutales bacterium]|nr:PhoPQ-activated protein PqaA family protein [Opitutales bacterium]